MTMGNAHSALTAQTPQPPSVPIAQTTASPSNATTPPNLVALLECRQRVADFAAFRPQITDPLKAVALGWQPLPRSNPFMTEFRLLTPITVFGYPTQHIALSGGSLIAIIDLANPRRLAHDLQLQVGLDQPDKVIYGRELVSREIRHPVTGQPVIESIVLNVSSVHSHPGKTLVGCNYSFDEPE